VVTVLEPTAVFTDDISLSVLVDVFYGEYYDNIFIHFQPVSGWDYDWI
jgi:hypothetical protein